jgi:NADH-quinone oxidoreductase subunit H
MKFASFFMGEYAAMVIGSALVVTLFLGGWSIGFGADEALHSVCSWLAVFCQFIMFLVKLVAFIFFFVWVRWTLPRFRWDQVMKLGWLVFLELAVANIFLTAAVLYFVK